MRCGDLQNSWLRFRSMDLAQVRIDGHLIGTVWRAVPPHLRVHTSDCPDADAEVELAITVFAYGRDNFFPGGTATALRKGVISSVVLAPHAAPARELRGWKAAALPLVQPGRVLQWSGDSDAPNATTWELVKSSERAPFDSLHGGVWRATGPARAEGVPASGDAVAWRRPHVEHGPSFYRCAIADEEFLLMVLEALSCRLLLRLHSLPSPLLAHHAQVASLAISSERVVRLRWRPAATQGREVARRAGRSSMPRGAAPVCLA